MILCDNNYISYFLTTYTDHDLNIQDYKGNTLLHRVINQSYDYDCFLFTETWS